MLKTEGAEERESRVAESCWKFGQKKGGGRSSVIDKTSVGMFGLFV